MFAIIIIFIAIIIVQAAKATCADTWAGKQCIVMENSSNHDNHEEYGRSGITAWPGIMS